MWGGVKRTSIPLAIYNKAVNWTKGLTHLGTGASTIQYFQNPTKLNSFYAAAGIMSSIGGASPVGVAGTALSIGGLLGEQAAKVFVPLYTGPKYGVWWSE